MAKPLRFELDPKKPSDAAALRWWKHVEKCKTCTQFCLDPESKSHPWCIKGKELYKRWMSFWSKTKSLEKKKKSKQ